MRSSKHPKFFDKKITYLLVVGILLSGMTAVGANIQNSQSTTTRAAGPVCDDRCVHEIDCCQAVKANNDPYECAWPDRGWCFPDTCAPYTGQGTNCGWYWRFHGTDDPNGLGTNTVNGYGCMIGESEESMVPICDYVNKPTPRPVSPVPPTNAPKPTKKPRPTKRPRSTRAPSPTPYAIPVTATPVPFVTSGPNPTSVILYITTTPVPEPTDIPDIPESTIESPSTSTSPSVGGGILSPLDVIKNFFASFVSGFVPSSSNLSPKEGDSSFSIPSPARVPNIFEQILKKTGEFTKTIAP